MIEPQVSVVLPVFNGARYLAAAIGSVLSQDGLLEVLVHDDGSTDATPGILAELAAGDPRLSVSRAANAGPAAARNACLGRVRGSMVAFMDHDDLWPPGRLARQVALLAATPTAGGVIGRTCIFDSVDAHGWPVASAASRTETAGFLQACLFRRAAVEASGGFDASLRAADDFDFLLRMIEGGTRLTVDPEVAVYYRLHPGQWTADLAETGRHTAQALLKSVRRRRAAGAAGLVEWRLDPGTEG